MGEKKSFFSKATTQVRPVMEKKAGKIDFGEFIVSSEQVGEEARECSGA